MDRTPVNRGLSMGCGAALPHPRPGSHLRRRDHMPNARYGHPRQTHRVGLAVAEWLCRTADRIDPARVCGSFYRLGEAHLHYILRTYARYYNHIRTHWSLDKDAPVYRPVQRIGSINSYAILGGLHHHYVRV